MYLEYIFRKHSDYVPLPRQPIVIPLATVHSQNTFQFDYLTVYDAGRQQNNLFNYLFFCEIRLQPIA
jgi:hypothetical protein